MSQSIASGSANRWMADALAGTSVAVVLIPQSMAYAELAGMPAHYGLYAGALPPLLAAFFASSPYLQTGPVATTSLLAFGALSTLAAPGSGEYVGLAAMLALVVGVVRVAIGMMRAGAISYLMSNPVLRGFIAAAAVLILFSQIPSAVGAAAVGDGVLERLGWALGNPSAWEPAAIGLSAATLLLMLGGRKLHPLFPGMLVAVVVGVIFSRVAGYQGAIVGAIPQVFLPPFSLDLPWAKLPQLIVPGIVIALVGFAEAASLSQAFAEQTRQRWDPNREFVSQGVANLAAGIAGGFPVGGSFSRTALNKLAGAQTRWAGGITGLAMMIFLPFAGVLAPLPKAVLGAIVIGAVLNLLNPKPLLQLWRLSPAQAVVGYATFGLTLALAPRVEYAVLAGMGLALAVHILREQRVVVQSERASGVLTLRPMGVIWFGSAPLIRQTLDEQIAARPETRRVVLDLRSVGRVDLTGAQMLAEVALGAQDAGLEVGFRSIPPHAERILGRVCPDLPHFPVPKEEDLFEAPTPSSPNSD